MKTNFRQRSKRRSFVTALIALLAVVTALVFLRGPLGYIVSYGITPLRDTSLSADSFGGRVVGYFRGVDALVAERDALREDVRAKDAELATLAARTEDQGALGTLDARGRIPAGVLFGPAHTPYDTLVIDRGTAAGVAEGRVVYAPGDVAIGIVIEAYRHAALVQLFSSPGVHSRVYVHGPDVAADAVGVGGGVIRVSVPQGLAVAEGNVVVLPTLSSAVFGTISTIEADPASPTVEAYVTMPVALSSLRFVSVSETAYTPFSRDELQAVIEQSDPDFTSYFAWPEDLEVATTTDAATTTDPAEATPSSAD